MASWLRDAPPQVEAQRARRTDARTDAAAKVEAMLRAELQAVRQQLALVVEGSRGPSRVASAAATEAEARVSLPP